MHQAESIDIEGLRAIGRGADKHLVEGRVRIDRVMRRAIGIGQRHAPVLGIVVVGQAAGCGKPVAGIVGVGRRREARGYRQEVAIGIEGGSGTVMGEQPVVAVEGLGDTDDHRTDAREKSLRRQLTGGIVAMGARIDHRDSIWRQFHELCQQPGDTSPVMVGPWVHFFSKQIQP